jgi:hypothetical protein
MQTLEASVAGVMQLKEWPSPQQAAVVQVRLQEVLVEEELGSQVLQWP